MSKLYYTVIELSLAADADEITQWLAQKGAKEIRHNIRGYIQAKVDYSTYKELEKLPGVDRRSFDDNDCEIDTNIDDRLDELKSNGVIEGYEYVSVHDGEQLVLHFPKGRKLKIAAESDSAGFAGLFLECV